MESTSLGKEAGSVTVSIHCLFRRLRLKCPFSCNKYPPAGGSLLHENLYNGKQGLEKHGCGEHGCGRVDSAINTAYQAVSKIQFRDALASSVLGGKPFRRLTSLLSWLYCWSNL
jgi:hypothetical protein